MLATEPPAEKSPLHGRTTADISPTGNAWLENPKLLLKKRSASHRDKCSPESRNTGNVATGEVTPEA